MCLQYKSFENTVGNGEIALMSDFSFSQCFYPFVELSAIFIKYEVVVCKLSVWKSLKFVVWERAHGITMEVVYTHTVD